MKTTAYFPFDEFMPAPDLPEFGADATLSSSSVTHSYFPETSPLDEIFTE